MTIQNLHKNLQEAADEALQEARIPTYIIFLSEYVILLYVDCFCMVKHFITVDNRGFFKPLQEAVDKLFQHTRMQISVCTTIY